MSTPELFALKAVSPVDGRYHAQLGELARFGSEEALIGYRIRIEAAWLLFMARHSTLKKGVSLPSEAKEYLAQLVEKTEWTAEALDVKALEKQTNHDVKAVEYFLRDRLKEKGGGESVLSHIHFACTSEDINNVAYGLMLKDLKAEVILPFWRHLTAVLCTWADHTSGVAMLARTHGQPASPTTFGKELAVFAHRLHRQVDQLAGLSVIAKWSGAVGNYNAHQVAFPELKWDHLSRTFLEELGLKQNPLTTQIESHDNLIEHFDVIRRFNAILLGFCRDIWGYISIGYLRQRTVAGEVGSSTMPHKVNPIDFENAEGNLGIAIAMSQHFAEKLPVSRWQRDLSDSTVLRNIASMLGYSLLAYKSVLKGVSKLDLDSAAVSRDLDDAWEVLAEAYQTVMRRFGIADAYERLKQLTRGQKPDRAILISLFDDLSEVPETVRARMREMTPKDYTGLAQELTNEFLQNHEKMEKITK